jgi:hypothetical protein
VRRTLCALAICLAGCDQSSEKFTDESPHIEQASAPPALAQSQRLILSPQMVEEAGILVEPVKRGNF